MKNPVCWWESASNMADETAKFFTQVFDWEYDHGGYSQESGQG